MGVATTSRAGDDELLLLLRRDGILHRSEDQPVLSRDGTSARWMLDSLAVTLTGRGSELAARALLRLLDGFEGRQLATLGLTGVPLLQGCVLHGEGRYRGALVRRERKAHGSRKLIEGRLDPTEPVIIVDDSVSSGTAMSECADRLEEAGFHVEGGVCLVRFGYARGFSRLCERGFKMAALFDIFQDFMPHIPGEDVYLPNPTKDFGELVPSARRSAERPHPAHLAREVIAEYLSAGSVLGTPTSLDRDYDSSGGCWVSLRRRSHLHVRPARDGFWHFPDESRGTAVEDVTLAAVRAARDLARAAEDPLVTLADCAIAVTFFSALEETTVGELDNDRYGIVVRSAERPARMGGALPRMPGIANEWEQFAHAWRRNAKLLPTEPYRLYRHEVHKQVEPGEVWQLTGTTAPPEPSWHEDPAVLGALAVRARARVIDELEGEPADGSSTALHPPALPPEAVGLFVTIYAAGRLVGCVGGLGVEPAAAVDEYATAALRDSRFPDPAAGASIAVSVSVLHGRHEIGGADRDWVVGPVRFARQALEVHQRDRHGLVLPFVAVTHNLSPRGYVDEVVDKAGITRPPYRWTRYDCATWLAGPEEVVPIHDGLPRGEPEPNTEDQRHRLHRLLLRYTRRHHVTTGDPTGRYEPFADRLRTNLGAPRLAFGAWIKARAGLVVQAREDLARLDGGLGQDGWIELGEPPTVAEVAFTVLARLELGHDATELAGLLWDQIGPHGRIATHREPGAAQPTHQDYAPGQVLLALAHAVESGATQPRPQTTARALSYYRRRFAHNQHWGAVSWLAQAFVAWGGVMHDPELTAVGYDIVDTALAFQSAATGGFLNDHQSDPPGATTALYLEGVAAVHRAADEAGDPSRRKRYALAAERGLRFLDRLVYQQRDAVVLPNPEWALGGLRTSLTASEVRIDYVHHALGAVLDLAPTAREHR